MKTFPSTPDFPILTLYFCVSICCKKRLQICYNDKGTTNFDPQYKKPRSKRKLTGLCEKDLDEQFRVSVATVSGICRTWIKFVRNELQSICIQWPSKEQILHYMPPVFKSFYPNLVSIIDCIEV